MTPEGCLTLSHSLYDCGCGHIARHALMDSWQRLGHGVRLLLHEACGDHGLQGAVTPRLTGRRNGAQVCARSQSGYSADDVRVALRPLDVFRPDSALVRCAVYQVRRVSPWAHLQAALPGLPSLPGPHAVRVDVPVSGPASQVYQHNRTFHEPFHHIPELPLFLPVDGAGRVRQLEYAGVFGQPVVFCVRRKGTAV